MVMFVMIIAIMSIMMGAAVEIVSFQMQREREAELIFRGEQYVESIRLFRLRFGRYPMRLKEIWEADPKVIRKAWKDPMTDSLDWGLIFLGEGGEAIGPGQAGGAGVDPTGTPGFGGSRRSFDDREDRERSSPFGRDREDDDRSPFGVSGRAGDRKVGPIIGVHSTHCETSIKVYEGRTDYCQWRFIFQEQQEGRGGQGPGARRTPTPDDRFPFGSQPIPPPPTPSPVSNP
jgi:type II secretory pathway pseudopilin PulG